MTRKFHITTFGCRTNQADSAILRESFLQEDFRETAEVSEADVIVVNSCTVTHRSDQQVRQMVRRLRRENRSAQILVTGCYAQREPEAIARIAGVTAVVGNTHKNRLVDISLSESAGGFSTGVGMQVRHPNSSELARIYRDDFTRVRSFDLMADSQSGVRTRPFVKIQDGCDARCSYCIIPAVRGPSRSVPPQQVLQQVRNLVDEGFKEIVLTGIHMATYGLHLVPRYPLNKLLEAILDVQGLHQIRLSSLEPMQLSRKVIRLAASSAGRIAPHFHVCLQSGCDRTLRRMLRPYSTARFAEIAQMIRQEIPEAGIGTDIITGFPGETDEDHLESLAFVEQMPFTYLHVFPYSDRSGTRASKIAPKVAPEVVQARSRQMRSISKRKNLQFRKRFLGRTLSVITLDETRDGARSAISGNYLKARVPIDLPANEALELPVLGLAKDSLLLGQPGTLSVVS